MWWWTIGAFVFGFYVGYFACALMVVAQETREVKPYDDDSE